MEQEESQLLAALRAGDEAAFKQLIDRYHASLVRVAQAYVPTRAPLRYRYASYGWDGARRTLTIRLTDKRYANRAAHTIAFTARPFRGDCAAGNEKGFQVDGNRTYSSATLAWRCLNGVKLSAAGPNLPEVALAQVVASAKRVRL